MVPKDLVEAGAQEAGRALALLLRRPAVSLAGIDVLSPVALATRLAPRALVVAFTVSGGLPGRFALVATEAHARVLARDLVGGAADAHAALGKQALGALTELGNIGASAYLNGVARALNTACVPSVPEVVIDAAAAALTRTLGAGDIAVARLDTGTASIHLCLVR